MDGVTVVLGASEKANRYSNLAIRRFQEAGHAVVAIGRRAGHVGKLPIHLGLPAGTSVDLVTIYLSEENQETWTEEILRWRPRCVIFNPGAENPAFAKRLRESGTEVLNACTLVMLATGQLRSHSSRLG